jgi:hypothetical protein
MHDHVIVVTVATMGHVITVIDTSISTVISTVSGIITAIEITNGIETDIE